MTQVVLDFESSAFAALRLGPAEFIRELKTAAALGSPHPSAVMMINLLPHWDPRTPVG